jgi:hypothetical protein
MAVGFKLFYIVVVLLRTRCELIERERNSAWVNEVVQPR